MKAIFKQSEAVFAWEFEFVQFDSNFAQHRFFYNAK